MSVVDSKRLFSFLKEKIEAAIVPSSRVVFLYEGTVADELIWRLVESIHLPFKAYYWNMVSDRPAEKLQLFHSSPQYEVYCRLDELADPNGFIIGNRTRNQKYEKPIVFRNRYLHPLEDIYEGEVMELLGMGLQSSPMEERILREDDRNGILSSKDPAKHPEYFKYSQQERESISKLFGLNVLRQPVAEVILRDRSDLVR